MSAPSKSLLFIADCPARNGATAAELLEMLLSAATFGLPTALLLRGTGLSLLNDGLCSRHLSDLPVYGVRDLYVDRDDLAHWRNLHVPDTVTPLSGAGILDLYRQYDRIIQP